MRTESGTRMVSRLRTPLVVLVAVVLLASLLVGVRQVTVQLRSDDGDRSSTALVGVTDPGDPAGDGSAPAGEAAAVELQTGAGEPAPTLAEVSVGPVEADREFTFDRPPDRVALTAGAEAARAIAQQPDTQAPPDGSSTSEPDGGAGSGPVDAGGPPAERAPDEFTMVASAKADGYLATVRVALGGGLEGGLAALTIDFGDGTDPFVMDDGQITSIGSRGLVSVTHTYEPTLTLQPQTATVVATDGTGQAQPRTLEFETRAPFRLSYSPLTVTPLKDCDPLSKGDFKLTWQNDSSLPAGKTSKFKLGRNDSYVEREFPTTVAPVYYGELPDLFRVNGQPAFFYLRLVEEDNVGAIVLNFYLYRYKFRGPGTLPDFLRRGPVAQLGNHQYGMTMHQGSGDCDATAEFRVALTML